MVPVMHTESALDVRRAATRSVRTPGVCVVHLTGFRGGSVDRFSGDRVVVGRGRRVDLRVDPSLDRSVSARHLELMRRGDDLVLRDLGSMNGTYVNGLRVHEAVVRDGDIVMLGVHGPRFRVYRGIDATPPPGDGKRTAWIDPLAETGAFELPRLPIGRPALREGWWFALVAAVLAGVLVWWMLAAFG